MRETVEMVTASLIQNMVQIRKTKYFVTEMLFPFGALGVESPHSGAIWKFRKRETTRQLLPNGNNEH